MRGPVLSVVVTSGESKPVGHMEAAGQDHEWSMTISTFQYAALFLSAILSSFPDGQWTRRTLDATSRNPCPVNSVD